jgi:hypothetical protein
MPTRQARPARAGRTRRTAIRTLVWLLLVSLLLLAAALWWVLRSSGRSPAEVLDYVDRRLAGHPRIEALAAAPLALTRAALDAPKAEARLATPFVVPPPPPRRGPQEVPAAAPAGSSAKVWRVGPAGPLLRVADAARLAGDGDVVEIEAGDYRGDVAVWPQSRLTIRGVNGAARLHADGQSAEGKAIWVIRRGEFDVSNIDFIGAKVGDGNGAGIRFEGGRLRVSHCLFWGNQMGLLTSGGAEAADARLEIESSEFAYSHVDGRWGHNLYVGAIAEVRVTSSYFHHAGRGHLIKSRARRSVVTYNRLTDESGGRASYELDFPNGGVVRVLGNIVQQQPETDNSTLIAYGEEGYQWPENRLEVVSNTLVNDLRRGGTFIFAAPGATAVVSANNLLVGPGLQRAGDRFVAWNDVRAEWEDLERPARLDYRLKAQDPRFAFSEPPMLAADARPVASYRHPRGLQARAGPPDAVGALPPMPR